MKLPLAWLNLLHERARTAVAIAGVAFAVVLILMQLGFFGSVQQTATRIYDQLEFDLLLTSPQYLHLSVPGKFPRTRLYQAASTEGVASAEFLDVGFNLWRNPETGQRRGIMILGIDPATRVFRLSEVDAKRNLLVKQGDVLMDRMSRDEFGPVEPGVVAEVGRKRVQVVGDFALGTGFGADGAIIVADRTFHELVPGSREEDVSLGLLRLDADADPKAVAERLRAALPADVQVFTRDEIETHERRHWITKTSVGIIFGLGVVVAVFVGTAIVYQVLSSDIASHLPEYATLKAMGYGRGYLSSVVLQQAIILAVVGFVPGLLSAELLYRAARQIANVPIDMTLGRMALVLCLSIVMCAVSGLASLAKENSADPADLF